MKKPSNYDTIDPNQNSDFPELQEGPVYVKIVSAVDYPQKEYVKLEFETKEGYGKQYFEAFGKWPHALVKYMSYKDSATQFFKGSITAIEKTNPGFVFNWDESTLVNKYVYANLGYEEYMGDNGVAIALKCTELRSKEAYEAGKIKTPKVKKLPQQQPQFAAPAVQPQRRQNTPSIDVSMDDLPF